MPMAMQPKKYAPSPLHAPLQQQLAAGSDFTKGREAGVVLSRTSPSSLHLPAGCSVKQAFLSITLPASGGSELAKQHFPSWNFPRIQHPHLENVFGEYALDLFLLQYSRGKKGKCLPWFAKEP